MTKLNISAIKKQLRKDRQSELPAFLGNLSGTVSADRNGNVYATLLNGEVLTVYNGMVPNVARLPIVIGYGGSDKLRILRSRDVYVTPPFPDVPGHAALHTFPGVDTVPIRAEQFLPGLVTPAGGYTVKIYGLSYQLSDGWHVLPTQTLDLEASVPADGAVFALLEVDDTGIVQVTLGSAVDSRSAMEYSDIPATSSNCIALAAVKLYTGQTNILQTINNDNDIIDLRFGRASAGGVQTISGDGVDNTDPLNPVLSYPTPADIGAELAGAAATAETNAKLYADGLVVGLWDDRGSYDASGGAYPSTGGSGSAGAIKKGDVWTISVAGTLPTGQVVEVGDIIRALVDTPGNTQANWAITQNNIGYVAENSANKATAMAGNTTSNIVYLTAKAIYDWATGLFSQIGHTHAASDIASGTIDTARLGSGTADNTKFLRGDQVWATPAGGASSDGWTAYSSVIPTRIVSPLDGTFTVTIASPAVFTKTGHGLITGSKIRLTTSGALPTGLAANTDYFVVKLSADTFGVATSLANAVAETPTRVNTSGSQSGTHSIVHQTDPAYWMQFAGVDLTTTLYFGMPIKWTQNSIVRYGFICTTPSYSGGNTKFMVLTRCDGTSADYDLLDTGTYAVSAFYYGLPKLPGLGFPISNDAWKLNILNETNGSKASPTAGVTYNPANVALVLPPGIWDIFSGGRAWTTFPSNPQRSVFAGCSSAQDSFSDSELTFSFVAEGTTVVAQFNHVKKQKTLSAETTFFHLVRTDTASATTIQQHGATGVGTYISAISGFLN